MYAGMGTAYALWIPLWEAPDEAAHFYHVHHVAEEWRPPPQIPVETFKESFRVLQRRQAPLFYWISAPLLRAAYALGDEYRWDGFPRVVAGSLHSQVLFAYGAGHGPRDLGPLALRIWSVLIGGVTVYCSYALAMLLLRNEAVAIAAASICAFTPSFVRLSATINNDSLAIAFSSLSLVGMAAWLRSPQTWPARGIAMAGGAAIGAILSKGTALMLPVIGLWVVGKKCGFRHSILFTLGATVVMAGVLYALSGVVLHFVPIEFLDSLQRRLVFIREYDFTHFPNSLQAFHSGWWIEFGWSGRIPVRPSIPIALDLVALSGAAGFLMRYGKRPEERIFLGLIGASLLFGLLVVIRSEFVSIYPAQPRYLYPVISCFSLAIAAGLHRLLGPRWGASLAWSFVPLAAVAALALKDCVRVYKYYESFMG